VPQNLQIWDEVFLECDVSSIPREIDLEEIRTYVPSAMTHDFIPTTIVAPHVESVPLTKNSSATPTMIENEDVPIVNEQQAEDFGQMRHHLIMNKKWNPNNLKRKIMNLNS
jgi:hypothetical protein